MFKRAKLSSERLIELGIHTTSPGDETVSRNANELERAIREPKHELYLRANQFYLRSRLSRLRKSSSSIL